MADGLDRADSQAYLLDVADSPDHVAIPTDTDAPMDTETKTGDDADTIEGSLNVSKELRAANQPTKAFVELPLNDIDGSPELKEFARVVQQTLNSNLYYWSAFPMKMPPTVTEELERRGVDLEAIFFNPHRSTDEVADLALDEHGNTKRLSSEQLQEVRQKGSFHVASKQFPGKSHVWCTNHLLQKGSGPSFVTLMDGIRLAVREIIYSMPCAIVGFDPVERSKEGVYRYNTKFSLAYGLYKVYRGAREVVNMVIGVPELVPGPAYDNKYFQMKHLATLLRCAAPYAFDTKAGNVHIDARALMPPLSSADHHTRLNVIASKVKEEWKKVKEKKRLEWLALGVPEAKLPRKAVEQQLHMLFVHLQSDPALTSSAPNLPALLGNMARVTAILFNERRRFIEDRDRFRSEFELNLIKEHPFLSGIDEWTEYHCDQALDDWNRKNRFRVHEEALTKVEVLANADEKTALVSPRGGPEPAYLSTDDIVVDVLPKVPFPPPAQDAYLIRSSLEFQQTHAPILKREVEAVRVPRDRDSYRRRIWKPANWIKYREKKTNAWNLLSKKEEIPVHNGVWLWRLWWLLVAVYCDISNAALFAYEACFEGAFSFRVLFGCQKYRLVDSINRATGEPAISVHAPEQVPFVLKIGELWDEIARSREDFENAPDSGLVGKTCTRYFNVIWNYLFKGLIGTLIILLGVPLLCVVWPLTATFAFLLSPLWSLGGHLLLGLLRRLFFDGYSRDVGYGTFPLISVFVETVLWLGLGLVALMRALAAPLFALAIVLFSLPRWLLRRFWDNLMYLIVLRPRGRVPGSDSFLARRISGPGLSASHFFTISVSDALLLLQLQLETYELNCFRTFILDVILGPERSLRDLEKKVLQPYGLSIRVPTIVSRTTAEWRDILSDMVDQRQRTLRKVTSPVAAVRNQLKMSAADLDRTLARGTEIVQHFVVTQIFQYFSSPEAFWESQKSSRLAVNDWLGLTKHLFQQQISSEFLRPLEATDDVFSLRVNHVDVSTSLTLLTKPKMRDDLASVSPVIAASPSSAVSLDDFDPATFLGHSYLTSDLSPITDSFDFGKLWPAMRRWMKTNGFPVPIDLDVPKDAEDAVDPDEIQVE